MVENISCVIIAKNAEDTIKEVLDSLIEFNDVVLYSNNSTDKTNEIAIEYENVNLIIGTFDGFGTTKNRAATYAKNDWIFSLDADEVLSEEFRNNLNNVICDKNDVYSILRVNYYKSQKIKYCWGNDILIRLYNRNVTSFTNDYVHEKILVQALNIKHLDGEVNHIPYQNISQFIMKADYYSTLFAQNNMGKKKSSPLKAFFNGMYSFFRTYVIKRGFMDGYIGLIISYSHMVTNFFKYIKLYELNKELKERNISLNAKRDKNK